MTLVSYEIVRRCVVGNRGKNGCGTIECRNTGGNAQTRIEIVRKRRCGRIEGHTPGSKLSPTLSHISPDMARQSRPQALRIMKLTICGVIFSAGMTRSPSFSRCSSSTRTIILPARSSASASSMLQNPFGRFKHDRLPVRRSRHLYLHHSRDGNRTTGSWKIRVLRNGVAMENSER